MVSSFGFTTAIYAEHEALIEIETGNIHEGFLPKKPWSW